jgi:hypothetical protein
VREGYRLCLAYNLALLQARRQKTVAAPRTSPIIDTIVKILSKSPSQEPLRKVAIALDHQYTRRDLNIFSLQGVDRTLAEVLFDAAEKAGGVAHLALITHWQSGSARYEGRGYERGYESWSYDEDDDEGMAGGTGHEMDELYDERLSLDHWSDRDGESFPFGKIPLDDSAIVCDQPREGWSLSQEEFEGYTGNAGMTLESWYHRAAIVIWPKEHNFEVLCKAGTDATISWLKLMVDEWKRLANSEQQQGLEPCRAFAAAIIKSWMPHRFRYDSHSSEPQIDRSSFLNVLQELDDTELVHQFLTDVMPANGDVQVTDDSGNYCKRHGWSAF